MKLRVYRFLSLALLAVVCLRFSLARVVLIDKPCLPIIAIDLREFRKASVYWSQDLAELVSEYVEHGVNAFALSFYTLDELRHLGEVVYLQGWQIINFEPAWGYRAFGLRPQLNPNYVYIDLKRTDPAVTKALNTVLPKSLLNPINDEILELKLTSEALTQIPLKLSESDIDLVKRFKPDYIIIRIPCGTYPEGLMRGVEIAVDEMRTLYTRDKILLLPAGKQVIGYPRGVEMINSKLRALGYPIGYIEAYLSLQRQRGIEELLKGQTIYKVISVSLLKYKDLQQILDSVKLGLSERSVAVVYITPLTGLGYQGEGRDVTFQLISELGQELRSSNSSPKLLGPKQVEDLELNFCELLIVLIILTFIISSYLLQLINCDIYRWLLVFSFVPIILLGLWGPVTLRHMLYSALVSTAVTLLVYELITELTSGIKLKLISFIISALTVLSLSLIGGITLQALTCQPLTLLGIVPIRGIKLILIIPPLLSALIHVFREPHGFPRKPVTWSDVLIISILVIIGIIYLWRSSNLGKASHMELILRHTLQDLLGVRPRLKEFLLGYPSLAVWILLKGKQELKGTLISSTVTGLAFISVASILDSFAHLHTPILISTLRSLWGTLIGILLGSGILLLLRPFTRISCNDNA